MPTFNTYFPTSLHGWEIVNVKSPDYGAVGDGSTDDTAALQAAFDYAWGTRTSPHGTSGKDTNRAVYLPPGDYKVTAALYITAVQGGRLFGDSGESTIISLVNPMAGNLWRTSGAGSELSPLIAMNGCAFFTIDGISLRQLSPIGDPANFGSTAVWVFNYGHGNSGICTVPIYRNMTISDFQHGVLVGYGDPGGGNSENGTLYNVQFNRCTGSGLMAFHQNVLNWNVFGGGATESATEATSGNALAVYCSVGGAISVIAGTRLVDNGRDFNNGGGSGMAILGGHSTSLECCRASSTTFISGFTYAPPVSFGCKFFIVGACATMSGCVFAPEVDDGAGALAEIASSGQLTVDGLILGDEAESSSFSGSGNAALWVRGVRPVGSQDLFANYTGQIVEYVPEGGTLYAYMPAAAKYRGLTRVITDSPSTSGSISSGGGANTVFAYCTGNAWQIIGPAV